MSGKRRSVAARIGRCKDERKVRPQMCQNGRRECKQTRRDNANVVMKANAHAWTDHGTW
jgi:hypothetical protein